MTQADKDANELILPTAELQYTPFWQKNPPIMRKGSQIDDFGVDPLDGTKEFIAQNGMFVVAIGLAIDGESRLGVVYQPTEDFVWG